MPSRGLATLAFSEDCGGGLAEAQTRKSRGVPRCATESFPHLRSRCKTRPEVDSLGRSPMAQNALVRSQLGELIHAITGSSKVRFSAAMTAGQV